MSGPPRRWLPFGGRDDRRNAETHQAGEGPHDSGAAASAEHDHTAALDLIGRLLRLLGDVPVLANEPATAQLRKTYDAWARHVLTLAPVPGSEVPASRRDWAGLGQFVTEQRHAEQEQVRASLADLRQSVLTMAEAVTGSVAHEQADTSVVRETIGRLQEAADGRSVDYVRQEVRRAAQELMALATQRDGRQQELAERVAELSQQVRDLAVELRQARQASETDSLSGLLNRAGFDAALRTAIRDHVNTGRPMTLALVDLDDLKWVNDTHGHAAGDAAIGVISKSLRATFRATDVLARIGGDEFAVILADVGETIAAKVAERFLHELWTHNLPVDDGVIRVSASVGIAGVHSADGPRSWVDRADRRLYRAKGLGKNRVVTEISVDARS